MADLVGRTILHYRIVAQVGQGGMGVVYKAEDLDLKRQVAIKFLPRQIAAGAEERERFIAEAQAAAALNHQNIATVYSIEQNGADLFIVMEYVEGQDLGQIVAEGRSQALSVRKILDTAIQIASGLQAAHEKGITHRDIKSANILVTKQGQIKITDFGLAKISGGKDLTSAGTRIGTTRYMSPEQIRGEPLDPRSDIWSLGVVLYELLTGEAPFKHEHDQGVIYATLMEEPESISKLRPDCPAQLAHLVEKALTKDLENRFQQMDELHTELHQLREATSGKSPAKLPSRRKSPNRQRSRFVLGWLIMIAISVGVGIYLTLTSNQKVESIAVLPFKNLSENPDQEYFSDGLTEQLITELSKTGAFQKVISRTSAMQYKGVERRLPAIAKELDVDAVVEGAALHDNDKVRIAIKLIEGRNERTLWAETYEGNLTDILTLQQQVTANIVSEITQKLAPRTDAGSPSAQRVNSEAYRLFLRGRYHWNKRTEEGMKKSLDYFKKAIAADSTYALAFAGLADAYNTLADWLFLPPELAFTRARKAATKAIELDETLAEAHNSLAFVSFMFDWDWSGADQAFQRALQLNEGYATAHQWYAEYLTAQGQYEQALAEIERALELDPLSLIINAVRAIILFYSGQYHLAVEQCHRTLELDESFYQAHLYLAWIAEKQGRYDEADHQYRKVLELAGYAGSWSANPGTNYARSGSTEKAVSYLNQMMKADSTRHVSPTGVAAIYATLGRRREAGEWLEKAYAERETGMIYLRTFPLHDSLRANPRATELIAKLRLNR